MQNSAANFDALKFELKRYDQGRFIFYLMLRFTNTLVTLPVTMLGVLSVVLAE